MVGNVKYYKTLKFLQENICPSGACRSWSRSVDLNIEHVRWYWHVQVWVFPQRHSEGGHRALLQNTTKHSFLLEWSLCAHSYLLHLFIYMCGVTCLLQHVCGAQRATQVVRLGTGTVTCTTTSLVLLLILNIWSLFSIKDRTHVMSKISFLVYSLSLMLFRNFHRFSF